MTCQEETIVGREGVEDEHGEYTGKFHIVAQCNGTYESDCGFEKPLTQFDGSNDWWITSDEMAELHDEHAEWSDREK